MRRSDRANLSSGQTQARAFVHLDARPRPGTRSELPSFACSETRGSQVRRYLQVPRGCGWRQVRLLENASGARVEPRPHDCTDVPRSDEQALFNIDQSKAEVGCLSVFAYRRLKPIEKAIMCVPRSKAELLSPISTTFDKLVRELARVPLERLREPSAEGHAAGTMMSPADLVPCLLSWNELVLKRLEWDYRGDRSLRSGIQLESAQYAGAVIFPGISVFWPS